MLEDYLAEARHELITIKDMIRFGVSLFSQYDLFYGHGTFNCYDEVVYLILGTLKLPLHQLEPYLDARLLSFEKAQILDNMQARVSNRVPAAYLVNQITLAGYKFYIDQRAIIPRSFIAHILVNNELQPWLPNPEEVYNILDLCTGNGSLAIIASDCYINSSVIASDISRDALEVAKINLTNYGLLDRVKLSESNLFENLGNSNRKFDLIITNPPYVDDSIMHDLPPEYLHEPKLALAGGNDGLDLVKKILVESIKYLTKDGVLVVEMGCNKDELEQAYPGLPITWLDLENDGFVFLITYFDLKNYFSL